MRAAAADAGGAGGGRVLSLRHRLLMWLVLPLLATAPILGYTLYSHVYGTAVEWLDESLGDTALALLGLIQEIDGRLSLQISGEADRALRFDRKDRVDVLVLDATGHRLHGEARLFGLAAPAGASRTESWQFFDASLGGEPLRVARVQASCGSGSICQAVVAETLHKRDDLRKRLLATVALTVAALGGLVIAGGWLAMRLGLAPLHRLSEEIEQRNLDSLEPLDTAVPGELRPLIGAFNRLFQRLGAASDAQREFLGNAAHQLRTPLTSLQTEVDLALLENHAAEVEPLLRRLQAGVLRCGRMAHQMLSMARAEADFGEPARRLDLSEIAAQLAEEWVRRALAMSVDLGFELGLAPVQGHGFLLRELFENLVHNSLNYAGAGATVTVRTRCTDLSSWLEVEDDGPGIPEAERESALQRFRRGRTAIGPGSGLGLAIAGDIARRHGGRLRLIEPPSGGLLVRVDFPRV